MKKIEARTAMVGLTMRVDHLRVTHTFNATTTLPELRSMEKEGPLRHYLHMKRQQFVKAFMRKLNSEVGSSDVIVEMMIGKIFDEYTEQAKPGRFTGECPHCHHKWQGFYQPHNTGCPRAEAAQKEKVD